MRKAAMVAAVLCLVSLWAGLAGAQVKLPPGTPPKLPDVQVGDVVKPALKKLPDLVVEDFSVNFNVTPSVSNRRAWYPVEIRVKNTGQGPVEDHFFIGFEFVYGAQGYWTPDRTEDNAIMVQQHMSPGQSIGVSGYVKIDTAVLSGSTLQVRAVADTLEFEEFPPEDGRIRESNENNNYSSGVTIHGAYLPDVTGIDRTSAVRGVDVVSILGTGFGPADTARTVVVERDGQRTAADVNQWTEGVITFKVPQDAGTGPSMVYIGDKNTLGRLSAKEKSLLVMDRRMVGWETLINAFNNFLTGGFWIRLHTWSGGSEYENVSEMKVLGNRDPVPVNVPRVQFKTKVGYYRFLVNDMNSLGLYEDELGFSMNRQSCAANQMRLFIRFESEGKELVGYYKVLGPAGEWRRTGAPDIQVNDAEMAVLFQFLDAGEGKLDYQAAVTFSGDVHASGDTWNKILNLFMSGWDNDLKKQVQTSVRAAVNQTGTREEICESLKTSLLLYASLGANKTVSGYAFFQDGIEITYY